MLKRTIVLTVAVLMCAVAASAQTEKADWQMFKEIAKAVRSYPQYTVFDDVAASVDAGVVTLTGNVTMPFKAEDIGRLAARVAGVRQVRNQIEVLPVSQFDDSLRLQIARAIYGNPAFWQYAAMTNPPIHIVVEHGRVTLTGVVNNEVERALARSLASSSVAFSVRSELKTDAEMNALLEKVH